MSRNERRDTMRPQETEGAAEPRDIVVYHDYFAIRGGGERLALTLARDLQAHLVYGFRTASSHDDTLFPARTKSLGLERTLNIPGLKLIRLVLGFLGQRQAAGKFQVRIFSGVAAPFAAPKKGGGLNIFYCHTPPRFLFDQRKRFLSGFQLPAKLIALPLMRIFEGLYARATARMDVIVTNSENTRNRIKTYVGRDSIVVYPPVDIDRFRFLGQKDYYVSTARLTALKRVDLIVDAFLKMSDQHLVVVSGGEARAALIARAKGAPNIAFLDWVDDVTLQTIIGEAIATIYLPIDEDFGISPVESMAAGKPVIGVEEGGLLETIVPGETGMFVPKNFTADDVVAAVRRMAPVAALEMRKACEQRAQEFSRSHFISRMKQIIEMPNVNGK
ncbi:glycosyltransferase [Hyphomicrobium sp. CS1GBMeth3]|uniref:glycosyltransferase n=1 Tax=Hyphomicrobium sp. CS1GBMeth3 TaxID=1892845 RepID=UPI0015C57D0C|nr:glycosyltransferase [Hyphomicrobium sp. CS1GBMeth3]